MLDGVAITCIVLPSEDGFGDSGFEGCASTIKKVQQILRPYVILIKGGSTN